MDDVQGQHFQREHGRRAGAAAVLLRVAIPVSSHRTASEEANPLTEDVTRQHLMRVTLKLPSFICSLGSLTWKLSSLLPALTMTWQPFSGKSVTQGSNLM